MFLVGPCTRPRKGKGNIWKIFETIGKIPNIGKAPKRTKEDRSGQKSTSGNPMFEIPASTGPSNLLRISASLSGNVGCYSRCYWQDRANDLESLSTLITSMARYELGAYTINKELRKNHVPQSLEFPSNKRNTAKTARICRQFPACTIECVPSSSL